MTEHGRACARTWQDTEHLTACDREEEHFNCSEEIRQPKRKKKKKKKERKKKKKERKKGHRENAVSKHFQPDVSSVRKHGIHILKATHFYSNPEP